MASTNKISFGLSYRYECHNCVEKITTIRVKCTECTDFMLCLQCFASGAEIGQHKKQHGYQLLGTKDVPIFKTLHSKWTGKRELKLLAGLVRYGYGNWREVAKRVGKRFASEAVREHYDTLYVCGNIGKVTWEVDKSLQIEDYTRPENDILIPSLYELTCIPGITLAQQQQLCYMPLVDEFELEYDDEAENLICDLSFSPDDDCIRRGLKLAHLSMYNYRLRKRFLMKKIAREYCKVKDFFSSLKVKCQSQKTKPLTGNLRSYQDFKEQMAVFSRFFTEPEFRKFYENIQKEKQFRNRVKELKRIREHGFTSLKEARKVGFTKYRSYNEREGNIKKRAGKMSMQNASAVSNGESERGKVSSKKRASGQVHSTTGAYGLRPCFCSKDKLKDQNVKKHMLRSKHVHHGRNYFSSTHEKGLRNVEDSAS